LQCTELLFARCTINGEIVDANPTFYRTFRFGTADKPSDLFSIFDLDVKAIRMDASEFAANTGLPVVLNQIDGRSRFLFYVYQRDTEYFLFGINQELPDSRTSDLLSGLTTELGNLVRKESRTNRKLSEAYSEMEQMAHTDGLTGLYNHAHFMQQSDDIVRHADRHKRPVSIVMMDLDHFKDVNDKFGHQAGDEVLVVLGGLLRKLTRAGDSSARYGGEEFVTLLQDSDLNSAAQFAERIREAMESACPLGAEHPITLSLGAAEFRSGEELQSLLKRADEALYDAKNTGRNKVARAV